MCAAQDDFAMGAAELHKLAIEPPIWSFVQIKVQQPSILCLLPIKCPSTEKLPLFKIWDIKLRYDNDIENVQLCFIFHVKIDLFIMISTIKQLCF